MNNTDIFFDESGRVIASQGLAVPPPWQVRESTVHQGRFYFYNRDDKAAIWALEPAVLGLGLEPATEPPALLPSIARTSGSSPDTRILGRPGASAKSKKSKTPLAATPPPVDSARDVESIDIDDGRAPLVVTGGLGQGGYAVVLRAKHEETGKDYALKVMSKSKLSRSRDRRRLAVEIKIMTAIPPSPFLMKCHSAFETSGDIFFVLELVSGGDLFYHLAERFNATNFGFSEDETRILLAEVVLALQHLHAAGFVHRDVNVENVMLDARGHIKLVDFGLACPLNGAESPMSPMGSLIYMAPELLYQKVGGRHTDWWAVGILAFELLTGHSPWSSITDTAVIKREIKDVRVMPPRGVSPRAGGFICSLLKQDRARRLGTHSDYELNQAPFFASIDWTAMSRQETAPAFIPAAVSTSASDRDGALRLYTSGRGAGRTPASKAASGAPWFAGLDVVESKPRCKR